MDKPASANALGFDYWPMLWGGDQAHIDAFESAVTQGFGTIILGFNECVILLPYLPYPTLSALRHVCD